jgi:hypothetical protein
VQPGDLMPDSTVYLGQYAPKDRDGKSLGGIFNIFAAPTDLPQAMTYNDTIRHVAGLNFWHGHSGDNYANDTEIYAALKDGSYAGGWIIPPHDILHGKDSGGNDTAPDNIFAYKDKGALKGTFKMIATGDADYSNRYWSSTKSHLDPSYMWAVCLSDREATCAPRGLYRLSCRPVRLVKARGQSRSR